MFNCTLCMEESGGSDGAQQQQQFPSVDQLEAHLAADHFGVLPYECEQCQFAKFPTEYAVMKHQEQDHGNRSYSFRCRITPEVKAKRRRVREFLLSVTPSNNNIANSGTPVKQQNIAQRGAPMLISQQQQSSLSSSSSKMGILGIKKELLNEQRDEEKEQQQNEGSLKNGQSKEEKDEVMNAGSLLTEEVVPRSEHNENDCVSPSPTTLTEQIQAACLQSMRKSESATQLNAGRLQPAVGGTLEIREGAELTAASLFAASVTKNEVDSAAEGEAEGEDAEAEEQMEEQEQQADVQEILKAAAAAVSQVGGGANQQSALKRRSGSGTNGSGYSLRPNRFSPYALLHQGLPPQHSKAAHQQQFNYAAKTNNTMPMDLRREKVVDRIQCRKCHEMVNAQGGCLNHHTNTRHLRLPMFQCTLCNKDFFEVSNTRIHKHMRLHHGGDTSHLVSNYHKFSSALHAGRDDCFGRKEERMHAMRGPAVPNIATHHQSNSGRNAEPKFTADPCDTVRAIFNSQASAKGSGGTADDMQRKNSQQGKIQQQKRNGQKRIKREFGENVGEEDGEEDEEENGENNAFGGSMDEEALENEVDVDGEDEDAEAFGVGAETIMGGMFDGGAGESSASGQEQGSQMMYVVEEPPEEEEDGEAEVDGYGTVGHGHYQQKMNGQRSGNRAELSTSAGSSSNGRALYHQQPAHHSAYQQNSPYIAQQQRQDQQQFHYSNQSFTGTEEKIPCKVCGEMVWNKITNRLNHVNVRHLQLPLHECALCHKSFTSYSRSACYSHVQFAHKTEIESGKCSNVIEEHIIYRKERYNGQLLEAASEYF